MDRLSAKGEVRTESETHVVVDGVWLTVKQTVVGRKRKSVVDHRLLDPRVYVSVSRVVARDRKRKLDITNGIQTELEDAVELVKLLKSVAAIQTAKCTCDYRRGYSDHAEHCRSIYVASNRDDEHGYD